MSVADAPSRSVARSHRKWTIAEFDRLVSEGFLYERSGGEFLWDGEILEPIPENQPHVNALENLGTILDHRLPQEFWTVNRAHPIILREGYKPNPDLAVLIGPRSNYRRQTPGPADVALLVEISDTTYPGDVGEKLAEYARVGIAQYWVVSMDGACVRVFREPEAEGRYRVEQTFKIGERVPLELGERESRQGFEPIEVAAILCDSIEEPAPGSPSGAGGSSS